MSMKQQDSNAEKITIVKEGAQKRVNATLAKYSLYSATYYYWKKKYDSLYDAQLVQDVNVLSWNYSHLEGLYDIQIYRSADNKPMRAYATTNGRGDINFSEVPATGGVSIPASGAFSWKDTELGTARMLVHSGVPGAISGSSMQRTFKYKIMARHFDGGWSQVSEVVEIEVWVPGE